LGTSAAADAPAAGVVVLDWEPGGDAMTNTALVLLVVLAFLFFLSVLSSLFSPTSRMKDFAFLLMAGSGIAALVLVVVAVLRWYWG
jgi:hypothetical protein